MLSKNELNYLSEFFLLRNIKWKFNGEQRIPSRDELEMLLADCIELVQESDESVSIEIGSLLIKRTDNHIDVYVHVGAVE